MLKGCTNLTSLLLAETVATQDLEKTHKDVFLEAIAWLCECKALQIISMDKMLNAPGLLTPVLREHSIHLTKLELEGYYVAESRDFHQALAHQTSLQGLWLKGESSDVMSDVDLLVDSLSKLENLVDLRLRDVSDFFKDRHICQLARSLRKLETWWTSGFPITDAIWSDMATLRFLRRLELSAMTHFTANGIVDFIRNLGSENRGLVLNIMMQDTDHDLSEEEQTMIREIMSLEVEGRLEFTLVRGNCHEPVFQPTY